jgi:catechol 2,3-dioxygenase-like lactoylglutathione lyase family enzyme
MTHAAASSKDTSQRNPQDPGGPSDAAAIVRYQVADVDRAVAFYREQLGFVLDQQSGSAFAAVSRGRLRLLLSGPGSSGSRPMPDGRRQEPGGWNRIVLDVDDLASRIRSLEAAGVRFRNAVETGPGGKQIQIEDPDGNPIELHEPPAAAPR